jgi:WD40 repeat protein
VAVSPDGQLIAAPGVSNTLTLWNGSGEPESLRLPTEIGGSPASVAFSPDGQRLVAGTTDSIVVWDVATAGHAVTPLAGGLDGVTALAFSPDGKLLASGSCGERGDLECRRGQVRLWDLTVAPPQGDLLPAVLQAATSLAFSPDGRTLAVGTCTTVSAQLCRGGEVQVWDVATRTLRGEPLSGFISAVQSVAFSHDGALLATGGCGVLDPTETACHHGEVRLWDLTTHQPSGPALGDYPDAVNGLAFSPDDHTLFSSSFSALTLWDVPSRQWIGRLAAGPNIFLQNLALSQDGRVLVTGNSTGPPIRWAITPEAWIAAACAIANRNLTPAEWRDFFGTTVAYQALCPGFPVPGNDPTATPTPSAAGASQ